MPRPLVELHDVDTHEPAQRQENSLARNAARAFAAALSVLLIATLVINRSSDALTAEGASAPSAVSSGTISLSDDDTGRALFDLSDMAPGRPVSRCIEVVYDGTILPVDLAMTSETNGPLGRFLDVVIEEGAGGGFESCRAFTLDSPLYRGTLAEFTGSGWLDLGRIVNTGTTRTFRITVELRDEQDALGLTATADFLWEVTPS